MTCKPVEREGGLFHIKPEQFKEPMSLKKLTGMAEECGLIQDCQEL